MRSNPEKRSKREVQIRYSYRASSRCSGINRSFGEVFPRRRLVFGLQRAEQIHADSVRGVDFLGKVSVRGGTKQIRADQPPDTGQGDSVNALSPNRHPPPLQKTWNTHNDKCLLDSLCFRIIKVNRAVQKTSHSGNSSFRQTLHFRRWTLTSYRAVAKPR